MLTYGQYATSCSQIDKCNTDTADFIISHENSIPYSYVTDTLQNIKIRLIQNGPSTFMINNEHFCYTSWLQKEQCWRYYL